MFYKCLVKKVVTCRFLLIVFFLICLFSIMGKTSVMGQIFPYSPYIQPFFLLSSNTNNINPYSAAFPSGLISPNPGLYNPFSLFNSFSYFNNAQFYPQANVAGGLIPFTNFYANPFTLPYNAAAAYFAAALLPADVAGAWTGIWTSTFLPGGIVTGELSMTLAQTDTEVAGTAVFLLNKILKFGAYVIGTVEGNTLTLNSTVTTSVTGTMTYDVTITATVTDVSMEGAYVVINLTTGIVAEEGTFTATRL